MELFWTGLGSLLQGDPSLRGISYLWMFPIYGLAVFLEPVHERLRSHPWLIRGFIWMLVIFGMELGTGFLIQTAVGVIPWDYGPSFPSIGGYIRLDFAPEWFTVGLIFEQVHDFLREKIRL